MIPAQKCSHGVYSPHGPISEHCSGCLAGVVSLEGIDHDPRVENIKPDGAAGGPWMYCGAGPKHVNLAHWRRKSKHRAWESWPIYSAVFPWHQWQGKFARTHHVGRPLPKHPYALFLLFAFRARVYPPSHQEWHWMTRAAVIKHWKIWAHTNGYTWADFSRASAPKPTRIYEEGSSGLHAKMCHHCRQFLPISKFTRNGKPARRHICGPCDNKRRRPQ